MANARLFHERTMKMLIVLVDNLFLQRKKKFLQIFFPEVIGFKGRFRHCIYVAECKLLYLLQNATQVYVKVYPQMSDNQELPRMVTLDASHLTSPMVLQG